MFGNSNLPGRAERVALAAIGAHREPSKKGVKRQLEP